MITHATILHWLKPHILTLATMPFMQPYFIDWNLIYWLWPQCHSCNHTSLTGPHILNAIHATILHWLEPHILTLATMPFMQPYFIDWTSYINSGHNAIHATILHWLDLIYWMPFMQPYFIDWTSYINSGHNAIHATILNWLDLIYYFWSQCHSCKHNSLTGPHILTLATMPFMQPYFIDWTSYINSGHNVIHATILHWLDLIYYFWPQCHSCNHNSLTGPHILTLATMPFMQPYFIDWTSYIDSGHNDHSCNHTSLTGTSYIDSGHNAIHATILHGLDLIY